MNATTKWSLPKHKDLPCSEEAARFNGALKSSNVPTHTDLPSTDGRPMENSIQFLQIALLSAVLQPVLAALHPDGRFYVGRDVGIYYRLADPPLDGCKAPDYRPDGTLLPTPEETAARLAAKLRELGVDPNSI